MRRYFWALNQYICFGYSQEPSQWDGSFKQPKHKFKLIWYKQTNSQFTLKTWVHNVSGPEVFRMDLSFFRVLSILVSTSIFPDHLIIV